MTDTDLIKLIKNAEQQVVAALILNELCEVIDESDGLFFNNLKPSAKGKIILNKSLIFTPIWFTELKNKWPAAYRGNLSIVRAKIERFVSENECSLDSVVKIVEKWLSIKSEPYCGNMENLFYAKSEDGVEFSRAKEMLEEALQVEDDYRRKNA